MTGVSSTSSSTSSLFAGKNILSGLSSGLDTESMIENSVKGYQLKIKTLQQQQTKVEWKQDAVRTHIDSLNDFMNKYSGASSKTNLSSASFFTEARTTTVSGTHAGKVTAYGKSTSDIEVLSATMAKATKYTLSGDRLGQLPGGTSVASAIDWDSIVMEDGVEKDLAAYLSGKSITVDGRTLTIGDLTGVDPANRTTALVSDLQSQLNGTGISVNAEGGQLRFRNSGGTTLDVDSSDLSELPASLFASSSSGSGTLDIYNARVSAYTNDRSITINGATIEFDNDTIISELFTKINNSSANLTVSYSKITNDIVFTAKNTGNTAFEMDDAAKRLFGAGTLESGSNSMLTARVNGKEVTVQSSSNQFNLDGLTLTVKGSFETKSSEESLTFQTSANSDKIVDAVKAFVEDYNTIVKNLYDAFNTQPAKKSDKSAYQPLTDEDKADMSDTAIKNYEEKAKQGILFGDEDLKDLFNSLRSAISSSDPATQKIMSEIGLSTSYSGGVTTLTLNEDKLRSALDKDPDTVKNFFADSPGYKTLDGFASKVKVAMDKYASTSIVNSGILVQKAGSKLAPTSLLSNAFLKEIDKIQEQIDTWNKKMLKQVDFYTRLFSKLEQTMNTMNSQSSALASFGGY